MDPFAKVPSLSNRFISPFPTADRRVSPDNSSTKCTIGGSVDLNLRDQYESKTETNFRTLLTEESPLNRRKPEEDVGKMSVAELNLELDNNSTRGLRQ